MLPLARQRLMSSEERLVVLEGFGGACAPLPEPANVLHGIADHVARHGDQIALSHGPRQISYAQLWSTAQCAAHRLREAGVRQGDRVALQMQRGAPLVGAILATWMVGAAYVPIAPGAPTARREAMLRQASCRALVYDASIPPDAPHALAWEDLVAPLSKPLPPLDLARLPGCDAPAYAIFTSGSTGAPKGALVHHGGMLNHLLCKIEDLSLDRDSVVMQNASQCFDISVWQMFAALYVGGRVHVADDLVARDPRQLLSVCMAQSVTILEIVPSLLAVMLDGLREDRRLRDLRYLIVTGEAVQPGLVSRWLARFPSIPVVNAYGPTECSDDVTHHIMTRPPTRPHTPIGAPVRNVTLRILDVRGDLAPIGVPGEVCVSGLTVGLGYMGDPERTARAFGLDPFDPQQKLYRTGDRGRWLEDGSVEFLGRRDHQIKLRGHRVELGEIERALCSLSCVREACVVLRTEHEHSALAAYLTLERDAPDSRRARPHLVAARLAPASLHDPE